MKNLYLALLSVVMLTTPLALFAEQVKQAATDGMILNLGNYTQQIKVRAKALGSKNCNVDFSIQGEAVRVVAPVNAYSEWTGVGPSFLAASSEKLGVSVKCDAGAITQVQYHQ